MLHKRHHRAPEDAQIRFEGQALGGGTIIGRDQVTDGPDDQPDQAEPVQVLEARAGKHGPQRHACRAARAEQAGPQAALTGRTGARHVGRAGRMEKAAAQPGHRHQQQQRPEPGHEADQGQAQSGKDRPESGHQAAAQALTDDAQQRLQHAAGQREDAGEQRDGRDADSEFDLQRRSQRGQHRAVGVVDQVAQRHRRRDGGPTLKSARCHCSRAHCVRLCCPTWPDSVQVKLTREQAANLSAMRY